MTLGNTAAVRIRLVVFREAQTGASWQALAAAEGVCAAASSRGQKAPGRVGEAPGGGGPKPHRGPATAARPEDEPAARWTGMASPRGSCL
jgi:hypothetical protein